MIELIANIILIVLCIFALTIIIEIPYRIQNNIREKRKIKKEQKNYRDKINIVKKMKNCINGK